MFSGTEPLKSRSSASVSPKAKPVAVIVNGNSINKSPAIALVLVTKFSVPKVAVSWLTLTAPPYTILSLGSVKTSVIWLFVLSKVNVPVSVSPKIVG